MIIIINKHHNKIDKLVNESLVKMTDDLVVLIINY